ncbi:unnamed protein product [Calypogeia fissa]
MQIRFVNFLTASGRRVRLMEERERQRGSAPRICCGEFFYDVSSTALIIAGYYGDDILEMMTLSADAKEKQRPRCSERASFKRGEYVGGLVRDDLVACCRGPNYVYSILGGSGYFVALWLYRARS